MSARKPHVWVSMDAMFAQSRLPRGVQDKYSKLIVKLKSDPGQPGLNFESVEGARDRHMKSVRVDGSYRAIVYDRDGALIVLWVDAHDKAYRWAQNRVVDVNPRSAAVQVVDMSLIEAEPQRREAPAPERAPLFADLRDDDLLQVGVPAGVLPAVRMMFSEEDLDVARPGLPPDAFDALTSLAAGYSIDETLAHLDRASAPKVDVEDFAAALQTVESRRMFWLAETDDELEKMLDAPLEFWRVFLHPTQRRMVEKSWNGPVLVRGGAGTGKTVVAMHRARFLAERLIKSGDEEGRILFTTFTSNLAADIRENLKTLCSREAMKRIEVMNLDAWVPAFLRRRDFARTIVYSDGEELKAIWHEVFSPRAEALGLEITYVKDEWRQVVQAQGIASLSDYLRAQRSGRGTPLDRKAKTALWELFAAYRAKLDEHKFAEPEDAYREAAEILRAQPSPSPYRALIVDEAQDMGPEAFRLLAALAPGQDGEPGPDSLFIVGDAHQRIYNRHASLSKCGIQVRGRSRNLRINYRTTDEIRKWAVALLTGVAVDDLDQGTDDLKGYRSLYHGPRPELRRSADEREQISVLVDWIERCRASGMDDSEIGILGRTKRSLDGVARGLREAEIDTAILEPRKADDRTKPGVRLATMHRAKGLEFVAVAIVDANEGTLPLQHLLNEAPDKVIREGVVNSDRFLLHVAATRAKKNLLISSWGKPSALLPAGTAV